jgi:hypothetical protein
MHRPVSFVLLCSLAAPALGAQAPVNRLIVYPEDTGSSATYVGRPDWNRAAEGFTELSRDDFRGVGDGLTSCRLLGLHHWAADENTATPETYGVIFRHADQSGFGPDISPLGVIGAIPGLSTPTGAGGRGSWIMNDFFATPVTVNCQASVFVGLDFPANPSWPATDGHAMWRADVDPTVTVGENPRPNHPRNIAWFFNSAQIVGMRPETYILGPIVETPILQIGGVDPNSCRNGPGLCGRPSYGLNGLFPGVTNGRTDGITIRIRHAAAAFGAAVPMLAGGFAALPFRLAFIGGSLHLDFASMLILNPVNLDGAGNVEVPIASPGSLDASYVGRNYAFQAVTLTPAAGLDFSCAQATHF